jgi:methyl-accepting chemotaxis protein
MTINMKMRAGFACVVLITAILGGLSFIGLTRGVSGVSGLLKEDVAFLELADRIKIEMLQHRRYEKDFFLNIGNQDKQGSYIKDLAAKSESIKADIRKIEEMAKTHDHLNPEVKAGILQLSGLYNQYFEGFHEVRKKMEADPKTSAVGANQLMTPNKKSIHDLESIISLVAQSGVDRIKDRGKETVEAGAKTRSWIVILGFICLGLATAIGVFIPKSISRKISGTTRGLSDSADQVASAASQVSSSSQSLAEGSSEQAASIEETSSALEEMATITKQNADNTGQASALSDETKRTTESCSKAMQEMAAAIGQVSESSQETQKIVKTIDEIAFQTNLLALNAAVEAARAGAAGAGFAVVADEVRNLAMRAADAARNTSSQIDDISSKINEAMEMVFKCIDEFAKVDENTGKVTELVAEIAAASNEQAQGIEQINKAVAEMDRVVQQNAANAEESASASEEMSAQAESMKGMVGHLVALVVGGRDPIATQPTMMPDSQAKIVKRKAASQNIAKEKMEMLDKPSKEFRPDQVIPFDDEGFKDF